MLTSDSFAEPPHLERLGHRDPHIRFQAISATVASLGAAVCALRHHAPEEEFAAYAYAVDAATHAATILELPAAPPLVFPSLSAAQTNALAETVTVASIRLSRALLALAAEEHDAEQQLKMSQAAASLAEVHYWLASDDE
ncbi:hypothetical protein DQ384_36525 [Sphaerisporangium album]|uniref:DUF4439 domain-containing protein n=1 Tax=Sphaerisporangium album TaxID=509200 RepID=A0A367ESQ6_9ACTN|nr:hypothetical protein [Sphaerisporangium album]RCG21124.1 hypothetical protein DQ384_36525 [Sphaerisporangium album]